MVKISRRNDLSLVLLAMNVFITRGYMGPSRLSILQLSTASSSHWSARGEALRRRFSRGHCLRRRRRGGERGSKSSGVPMMTDECSGGRQLGDILAPEDESGDASSAARGSAASGGIPIEPPSFLKRLFSVPNNIRRTTAVGDVVVPVIGARDGWGGIRQGLVNRGIFPGVEYRILEVTTSTESGSERSLPSARDAPEGAFENGDLTFTMRPVYPLVAKLERKWPVRVPAREFPVMLTPFAYNAATAWASLTTSLSVLVVCFVTSQALTLSVIPSRSMEPTLQVGDVVLVEKVSRAAVIRREDIVFFRPPPALREVVASAGGILNARDLFVKRVAALSGDVVSVSADGIVEVESARKTGSVRGSAQSGRGLEGAASVAEVEPSDDEGRGAIHPRISTNLVKGASPRTSSTATVNSGVLKRIRVAEKRRLPPGTIFVLGDNAEVSMDSRVWGELDEGQIVGHALFRVLPLRSFGLLP